MEHNSFLSVLESLSIPPPMPTALSKPFWDAAAAGRVQLLRCGNCDRFAAYPRELCPYCWSVDRRWETVSGNATLETFTRVHQAGHAGWQPATPYVVGLVRLEEGPVLLTHILAGDGLLRAGATCHAEFVKVGTWVLPFFKLTGAAAMRGLGALDE